MKSSVLPESFHYLVVTATESPIRTDHWLQNANRFAELSGRPMIILKAKEFCENARLRIEEMRLSSSHQKRKSIADSSCSIIEYTDRLLARLFGADFSVQRYDPATSIL